jgi:hypothetical protein
MTDCNQSFDQAGSNKKRKRVRAGWLAGWLAEHQPSDEKFFVLVLVYV